MKKILLLILPLVILLNSCEEIVEGETLPHEEKLVVRGVLTPAFEGGYNGTIKITRTLPVLEEYSPEKAEVKDAEVFVEVGGVNHQLHYKESSQIEDSHYWLVNGYEIIQPGKTYSLKINWKGKTAVSTMRIPDAPDVVFLKIDSVKQRYYSGYEEWIKIVKAQVRPRANESYALTYMWRTPNGNYIYNQYFGQVKRFDEVNSSGLVEVSGDNLIPFNNITEDKFEVIVYVHAFDSQFAEYFKTRYNNYTDVTFSEPTKVKWNVFGNAIGMFTGYSTAVDTLEF